MLQGLQQNSGRKETFIRCPHCDKILNDAWVKRAGATLMGMAAAGKSKARSSEQAAYASNIRWSKEREKKEQLATAAKKRKNRKKT